MNPRTGSSLNNDRFFTKSRVIFTGFAAAFRNEISGYISAILLFFIALSTAFFSTFVDKRPVGK